MTLLAHALAAVLVVISAIHVIWALGFSWPRATEAELARTVVGSPGITKMPGAVACSLVAVALLFASAWAIWLTRPHGLLIAAGGWALTLVFLGRGLAAYIPAFRRLAPEQPFATLDRRYFGPLCMFLGAGFAILTGAAP